MDIGTVALGFQIGRSSNHGRNKYIWQACRICGLERWVRICKRQPQSTMCHSCVLKIIKPGTFQRGHKLPVYCLDCGKQIKKSKSGYCRECRYNHPEHNPGWKGGKIRDGQGHILIKLRTRHGKDKGYVPEHRLVWEKAYGNLPPSYVIHHLNGIPDDNRLENLCALSQYKHNTILRAYRQRIKYLEVTIRELRQQLNLV